MDLTETIKATIKEYETSLKCDLIEKHVYGTEMRYFKGTKLRELHINNKYHAHLIGIKIEPKSHYMPESVQFFVKMSYTDLGVCGLPEKKVYQVINQQCIKDIESFKCEYGDIYITLKP